MRIISPYKDYYDSIVGTVGIDNAIVFYRNTDELTLPFYVFTPTYEDRSLHILAYNWLTKYYTFFFVGFCGKIYPVVKITEHKSMLPSTEEYIYDIDTIKELYFKCYNQKDKYTLYNYSWDKYISQVNNKELLNLFQEKKIMCFSVNGNKRYSSFDTYTSTINTNICLKDISFFKVFDAFTAFNEISIFVGEQLNTEVDTFNLSDKQKVVSKGFDPVYGFRKRKK